jgi:hypothetical protein
MGFVQTSDEVTIISIDRINQRTIVIQVCVFFDVFSIRFRVERASIIKEAKAKLKGL